MSKADSKAAPRPRFAPPGGGNILTRRALARMLAQLEESARPRLQVEGAAQGTGNSLTFATPGDERSAQIVLDLRTREMMRRIPGKGRIITKATFAAALKGVVAGLGFRLDVDGAEKMLEDNDGGLSLRVRSEPENVYIFIEIAVFDTRGNFTVPVGLAARWLVESEIFSTLAIWESAQMLELPGATPPVTRTIEVTYYARFRRASLTGDPTFTNLDLRWRGPVELDIKKYRRSDGSIDATSTVLIDDPDGVTVAYSTTAARSGDELLGTGLTVL